MGRNDWSYKIWPSRKIWAEPICHCPSQDGSATLFRNFWEVWSLLGLWQPSQSSRILLTLVVPAWNDIRIYSHARTSWVTGLLYTLKECQKYNSENREKIKRKKPKSRKQNVAKLLLGNMNMFKKILISVFTIDLFGSSEVITVCREAMISEVI